MTQTRSDAANAPRSRSGADPGPLARGARFFREVIAELAKVIWPTRKELITYTLVVLIFVAIMVAVLTGLDLGFTKLVIWAFG